MNEKAKHEIVQWSCGCRYDPRHAAITHWCEPHMVCINVESYKRRLREAAPEMLEALRGMRELVEAWMNGQLVQEAGITWAKPEDHPPALRLTRALLARIEGEE